MIRRVRWYRVVPVAKLLPALAKAIEKERFRPDGSDGFVTESATKNKIVAAYVERLILEDRVEDPFGDISVYKRIEYRRIEFILGSEVPELQIRNSPRTCRAFLARLGEMASHEIAIDAVEVDVLAAVRQLEKTVGRVTVNRVAISGYPLSVRAGADLVVSGAGDVREDAKRFTANRYSSVTAASVSWEGRSDAGSCDISVNGVSFNDERGDSVERVLRDAVRNSLSVEERE